MGYTQVQLPTRDAGTCDSPVSVRGNGEYSSKFEVGFSIARKLVETLAASSVLRYSTSLFGGGRILVGTLVAHVSRAPSRFVIWATLM